MSKENETPDVPELDLETFVNEYGQDPAAPAPVETPPVEPTPAPTPAPTFDAQAELEALKSGYAEREKQYQDTIDQQNSRMSTLETLVNQGYQRAHAEPPKPEVPTFTEEELRTNPLDVIERVSDAKTQAAVQANNEQLSGVIGGLVERSWQAEMTALSTKPYFKDAKAEIESLVQQNPNMKLTPNSAGLAYNMIVGRLVSEGKLTPMGPTLVPPLAPVAPTVPRTPVPVPAPGGPPSPVPPDAAPPKKEPELTAAQQRLKAKFAGLDIGLTASDFEGE